MVTISVRAFLLVILSSQLVSCGFFLESKLFREEQGSSTENPPDDSNTPPYLKAPAQANLKIKTTQQWYFDSNVEKIIVDSLGRKTYISYDISDIAQNSDYHDYAKFAKLNSDGSVNTSFKVVDPSGLLNLSSSSYRLHNILELSANNYLVLSSTNQGFYHSPIIINGITGVIDTKFDVIQRSLLEQAVDIAIQADGKVLVAGSMTYNEYKIIRLNSDGSVDNTFTQANDFFNGAIKDIELQADGKIVVGGTFGTADGQVSNRIARINTDGSLDTGFLVGTGFNNNVNAIKIQADQKIVVVGLFGSYNGTTAGLERVARLNTDGTLDTTFNTNTGTGFSGGGATALHIGSGGRLFIGGTFSHFNGTSKPNVAVLLSTGALDNSVGLPASIIAVGTTSSRAEIQSILEDSSGKIYVGGNLGSLSSVNYSGVLRFNSNGSLDNTFVENQLGNRANSIFEDSLNNIFVAGSFTSYSTDMKRVNSIFRINADGSLDTGFNPPDIGLYPWGGTIQSDNRVIVATEDYGGNTVVRLNSDGSIDTVFESNSQYFDCFADEVYAQPDDKLLVFGCFSDFNGTPADTILRLNADGTLDTGFSIGAGGTSFTDIYDVAFQSDGKILIVGNFTSVNGVTKYNVFRLNNDGSLDTSFLFDDSNPNGWVYAAAVLPDGKIALGGNFTEYQGTTYSSLLILNSDGTVSNTFPTQDMFDGSISSMKLVNSKLYITGSFDKVRGYDSKNVVIINLDGSVDKVFGATGFSSAPQKISPLSTGEIVFTGYFSKFKNFLVNYNLSLEIE